MEYLCNLLNYIGMRRTLPPPLSLGIEWIYKSCKPQWLKGPDYGALLRVSLFANAEETGLLETVPPALGLILRLPISRSGYGEVFRPLRLRRSAEGAAVSPSLRAAFCRP